MNPKGKRNWAPYLLILPSVIYLGIFFAWPMVRSMLLAFRTDDTILNLRAEPSLASATVGQLPRGIDISILANQGIEIQNPEAAGTQVDTWYRVRGQDAAGQTVEGWAIDRRIREDDTWYRVRTLDPDTATIEGWVVDRGIDKTRSETWCRVSGLDADGQAIEGWVVDSGITRDETEADRGVVADSALNVRAEAGVTAEIRGQLAVDTDVLILEEVTIDPGTGTARRDDLEVRADPAPHAAVVGLLAEDTLVEILETVAILPDVGVVNRRDLEARADPAPAAEIVGIIPEDAEVAILERRAVEVWYQISGTDATGETREGWARGTHINAYDPLEGETVSTRGRIDSGDEGQWTLEYLRDMFGQRDFSEALTTTLLLMVLILPVQFILAIIMALVLQERLRGNTIFLYVFSIPLGISDLATGLVWFSIFQERGFLNSLLTGLGLIDSPITFINVETRHWIILAIVLAEVWRATSIVMVIVVSGLQAVPRDYLESAELFGANLWQRLRYVILPLLKPSLQVALILRTILAFQVFGVVMAIAGRGLTVLARETYEWYSEFRNPHMAAAYAGFILAISMITAVFYLRTVRTQQEREMAS